MMLPPPWPLLRTFIISVLAFTDAVSAQTLTFTWPKYPEADVEFPLTWDGGTPPYTVYVLTPDLTKYYYKYYGSDVSTTYDFPLTAGTEIVFQCRDSGELVVTSTTITVIETLYLQRPDNPQVGAPLDIQWGAGVSPYTVYVLTPDLTKYYWKYTGSDVSSEWTPDITAGTEVCFQVIDLNNVKVTSNVYTVQENAASASESVLSVLSTMSMASINSINSINSLNSIASVSSESVESVESTATLTSSAYSSPSDSATTPDSTTTPTTATTPTTPTPPTTSNGAPIRTRSTPGANGPGSTVSTTTSGDPSGSTGNNGGKKTNTGAIVGGAAGAAGLMLVGALGFFLAHQGGGAGHGGARAADSGQAGGGGQGGQGGQAPMREPAVPDVGGGYGPDLGAGAGFGGANAGSGAGANANANAGAGAAAGAGFQGGTQGFQGDPQGFQGGAQGFQGGVQGSRGGFPGADVGENVFTPDVQWGGGGFNPAYAGAAAGYAAGAGVGAVAAPRHYGEQNQEMPPPGEPFLLPQSISYGSHDVAAAGGARRDSGTDSPIVLDEMNGGTRTNLAYARDGLGHSPTPNISNTTARDSSHASRYVESYGGWTGTPEIQQ